MEMNLKRFLKIWLPLRLSYNLLSSCSFFCISKTKSQTSIIQLPKERNIVACWLWQNKIKGNVKTVPNFLSVLIRGSVVVCMPRIPCLYSELFKQTFHRVSSRPQTSVRRSRRRLESTEQGNNSREEWKPSLIRSLNSSQVGGNCRITSLHYAHNDSHKHYSHART